MLGNVPNVHVVFYYSRYIRYHNIYTFAIRLSALFLALFPSRLITVTIADHLINQFRGQEICAGLSFHRTEFDYIHPNNRSAMANFSKKIEQLVPT